MFIITHLQKEIKLGQYITGVLTEGGADFMSSTIRFERLCVISPSLPTIKKNQINKLTKGKVKIIQSADNIACSYLTFKLRKFNLLEEN